MIPSRRLTAPQLMAFAGPAAPMAALGLPLVVFLPEYYSNDLGLPLAAVGAAFALVRLLDLGVDPMLGALMDRTNTRFGRFRPWLAAGAPVLIAAIYQLFMARPGVGVGYLWFWLLVGFLGLSMAQLAHLAWAAKLSESYDGRSRTYAWVQALTVGGMIVVLLVPAVLALAAHVGSAGGVHAMGWLTIAAIPATFALALATVREPPSAAPAAHARLADYLALFRNRTILRLLATDQALNLAAQITGAVFFFYFEQVKLFSKGQAEALLFIYFLAGLCGAPMWLRLAYRLGKHRALAVAALAYVVTQTLALTMPAKSLIIAAPAMFLAGLPYSASGLLVRSMLADVGDAEKLETGQDRTGLFYGLLSVNSKIAAAIGVYSTFALLSLLGFNPITGASNSHQALIGLQALFAVGPAGLAVTAAAIIRGYPLTAERHAAVREKLDLLAAERDLAPDTAGVLMREPHGDAAE
jgi:GPH family glycoside/pentoside/hexuronide:cation symporter